MATHRAPVEPYGAEELKDRLAPNAVDPKHRQSRGVVEGVLLEWRNAPANARRYIAANAQHLYSQLKQLELEKY